jgi:hypothetical protein
MPDTLSVTPSVLEHAELWRRTHLAIPSNESHDESTWEAAEELPMPEPKRKKRKYRRYPNRVCTTEEKKALWEHQKSI